jgi:hypothetical protein
VKTLGAIGMYVLALGGFAVMMSGFMRTVGTLLYRDARNTLIALLRQDPRRAQMMCSVESMTFYEAIGAALKTAAMVKTRDPAILVQASQPAYDAAAMMLRMKWKKLVGRGKTGAVMAAAGVALALKGGSVPILIWIFAGLTVAGFIWVFVYKLDVDRSLILARQEVLPEVDRAFAEGRYVG